MMEAFVLSFRIIMPTLDEPDTIIYVLTSLLFYIICVILSLSRIMRH